MGKGLYSQITAVFSSEREFKHEYSASDHSITLEFSKTTPEELQSFENYDEALVKRVVIKDMSPAGTQIKIVLKNRNIRAHIYSQAEPFRVIVDLFEKDYHPEKDLKTHYPSDAMSDFGSLNHEAQKHASNTHLEIPSTKGPSFLLKGEENSTEQKPLSSQRQRRLLQPLSQPFVTTEDLEKALSEIPDGPAPRWTYYPPYIYKLHTPTYENRDVAGTHDRLNKMPSISQAMASSKSLAEFAGKSFDLGHDNKALILYNQLLQKDPEIFKKDATSLWKLAEIHLGYGNLTLARGYFELLSTEHPESSFAPFAQLRILDIQALRLIDKKNISSIPELTTKLDLIRIQNQGELSALIALRRAYWSQEGTQTIGSYEVPPRVSKNTYQILSNHYPLAESSRTAHLMGAILINEITEPSSIWNRGHAPFAEAFFKRFSGTKTDKTNEYLKKKLYSKINNVIQSKINNGQLVEAIEDYEALPASMKSVRKNPLTAWSLAESYRNLDLPSKALEHYQEASLSIPPGTPDRFKAEFWSARVAMNESRDKTKSETSRKNLASIARKYDEKMTQTWNKMNKKDQENVVTAYKDHLEKSITDNLPLRRPALIVLSQWSNTLSSKISTGANTENGLTAGALDQASSPSSSSVFLLADLGKVFGTLGMKKEKQQSIFLMSKLKPSDFGADQSAKNVWANELSQLAEEYRKANQYLDAGRLFGLVGESSESYEKRAETLYKSGLLLFRAGRKQEAIASFQKASEDGNNLFYANLAKERLNQIQ